MVFRTLVVRCWFVTTWSGWRLGSRRSRCGIRGYRDFGVTRRFFRRPPSHRLSLGESETPLVRLRSRERRLGAGTLLVKDEGRLPTGSFKARGLCMAVSMASRFGIERLAMPTNGNAGAAMAAYARRAGIRADVFCPSDTPEINIREMCFHGARVWKVNGLIHECGRLVGENAERFGWFDVSTLKEPYRIEGKKTMGLELAEQLGWRLPDVIFYPAGGGTGLIGMWKAFRELSSMGWLESSKMPRMVLVQAEGCAPMVRAWERGDEHAPPWEGATTSAAGIRVPSAVGDFLMLRAVRESGGVCMAISESEIASVRREVALEDGILLCPESAAATSACDRALGEGILGSSETAVIFNCATGLKYPMEDTGESLDKSGRLDSERFA